MHALILAAGKGIRMRGLCDAMPKPMLPLANRPMLRVILDGLAEAGVERAHVVIGHLGEQIRHHFEEHPHPLDPDFIVQESPNGTGSATALGRHVIPEGEPFLMAFGDIIVSRESYAGLVASHRATRFDAMLTTRDVPDPCHGAAVYVDDDGAVARIIEKPKPGTSTTNLDNAGAFIFPPDLFELLENLQLSPRGEYELTDALAELVTQGRLGAHTLTGFWFNMTDPEALIRANAAVAAESAKSAEPSLPDISSCTLTPPLAVGMGCRLENAALGPNVSIGNGCTLENGASVSNAILMPRCHIGAGATLDHAVLPPATRVKPGKRIIGDADHVRLAARPASF